MSDVIVSSLDPWQQQLAEKARSALERGQFAYVVAGCAQILHAAPGCVAVRRLQHAALIRRGRVGRAAWLAARARILALIVRAGRSDAAAVLRRLNVILTTDPTVVWALKQLAERAAENDWPETAVLAREAVRQLRPRDRVSAIALAEAYLAAERPRDALNVAKEWLRENPQDREAQALLREAAIAETTTRGNWTAEGSFRDKLKQPASA